MPRCSILRLAFRLLAASATPFTARAAESVWLTELDLTQLHFAGWRKPIVVQPPAAKPLLIAGRAFDRGVSDTEYRARVPRRGVVLLRMKAAK